MDGVSDIDRGDWASVIGAFERFFEGLGEVRTDEHRASFVADGTGFDVEANGGSRSFMPLHEARLRWERIAFDESTHTVTLAGGPSSYTYRVPHRLIDARDSSERAG